MAAIKMYVQPERIDGLCPHCMNPALRRYVYEQIDMEGITMLGTRVACTDCKKWIEPLKEYDDSTPHA